MTEPNGQFTFIFAPELYERLRWFVRLRWLAVLGLATLSLAGPRVGLPAAWPGLFILAAVVSLYNAYFHWQLWGRTATDWAYAHLRALAIGKVVLDLAALLAAVRLTGGMSSPLLVLFAFHMAIGTIMIATRTMYLLAGLTSLVVLGMYGLDLLDLLRLHAGGSNGGTVDTAVALNAVTLVGSMFGIVYLTDSVARRFKQRNIQLFRTTGALRERSGELQRLLAKVAEVERRKSHYMRISAHQLRSPLATVKTSLQVLSEGYVDLSSDRARRLVQGAVKRTDGLLAIVGDLLDLARIREGRGRAQWSRELDLKGLLEELLESKRSIASEQQIELVSELAGPAVMERAIQADLADAFENLVGNAIKYSHPGGRVTVRLKTSDGIAVARVIDQGVGIPDGSAHQVFLEFVRMPNARRHAAEGTGLGLAIVKEAVEAHGGVIMVESAEGEGTTFIVHLPLRAPASDVKPTSNEWPADLTES
jgi:signal transduction histidine kinase